MANCGTRDGTARPLRRVPHAGRRVASEALCRPCFRWYAPAAPADASHNALAPGASSRMANIYDVARAARVSVATVSAVVNDSAYVSPPLKARVQNAIRKLGYQPNLLARSLAKQQSHMLGMVVPDIANPFWPEVVRGAEDRAHKAGFTLLLANTDDDPRKEELYLDLFIAKRVDGILVTASPQAGTRDVMTRLEKARIPIVQVTRLVQGVAADSIVLDDRDAGYECTSHLLRLGYKRVGMIGGLVGVTPTERRIQGYRKALREWGRPFDRTLFYQGDYRSASGYEAGIALLKRKMDAVFISNYVMTVGFMKALRQYQLRCPQDVAVVTCDDHAWMDSFTPRLTTINFPKYELGFEAARVLLERLDDRDRPLQALELKSALSIRESCGYQMRVEVKP
jgi:LacI family transcriptional regulator